MTRRYFTSTAITTSLTAELSASATSMTVDAATFTGYPATFPYTLVLDEGLSTEEVIQISSAAGTTLTIGTRGVDSTTPQIHLNGASVKLGVSARDFNEANAHVYLDAQTATKHSGVHGLAGQVVGTSDTQTLSNKTLTSPTVTSSLILDTGAYIQFEGASADNFETILTVVNPTADHVLSLPNATAILVGDATTQTLTNKTLTSPIIGTSLILDTGATIVFEGATADAFETTLAVTDPTADRTVTIPDATTTLVGTDTTQTLTNKTLTSPVVGTSLILDTAATITFEGSTADAFETTLTVADPTADRTVTIPDATTTLVGTNTTQTLTNKSISGSDNTLTAIPLTTAASATWTSYTPTLTAVTTDPVLGTGGTAVGAYIKIDKIVHFRAQVTFGGASRSAGSGQYRIALPVASTSSAAQVVPIIFSCAGNFYRAIGQINASGSTIIAIRYGDGGTTAVATNALPAAWANGDTFIITGTYEAA